MAAITVRRTAFLLPIKPFLSLQGLYHKLAEVGDTKPRTISVDDYLIFKPGEIDVSKWKRIDLQSLGIPRTIVPASPYAVLQILRTQGFEAYLVGGCVRDLLLSRTPKDFDVITTANLDQISKQFHKCEVVGFRFPVCRIYIKGSVVEVSSFDTLAKESEGKEKFLESQMPKGCDKLDLIRWKNSMHRDFTINSLFFDPFLQKVYDYNDGMKDILELKLRTLVPAQLSFTEDSARILRGLRIAARLGLSLSKEIKSAIFKQISSISGLGQFRITMELNYMLSYGAAESSLFLLHKYHLLEILLPFQAAYISDQGIKCGQSPMMLMKLLSHLDRLVSCDRPCGSHLWIGLLGFHLALVNNPQHPFVILTLGSVLYHQSWEDGLKFARKHSQTLVRFDPETSESFECTSDDDIAENVNQLALRVIDSINALVDTDSLYKTMEKFPGFPCSGLVFIPHNMGHSAKQLFHVLSHKVETYEKGRTCFEMNYDLLKKGDFVETRFALGKIILDTMGCEVDIGPNEVNRHSHSSPQIENVVNENEHRKQPPLPFKLHSQLESASSENEYHMNEKTDRKQPPLPSKLNLQLESASMKQTLIAKLSNIMRRNPKETESKVNQNYCPDMISTTHMKVVIDPNNEGRKTNKLEIDTSESPMQELICLIEGAADSGNRYPCQLESQNLKERPKENTEVEVNQSVVENDETEVGSLLQSIQTSCKIAIEEARDSPAELSKLYQFLVSFVEEQVQRKKAKHLKVYRQQIENGQSEQSTGTSETDSRQLESSSLISSSPGRQEMEYEQSEASLISSSLDRQEMENEQSEASIGTSEVDSKQLESSSIVTPSVVSSEELKITQSKKFTRVKLSIDGEKKKQRVCSYCKEVGHNKTGCLKRKVDEASSIVDAEAT